VTEAEAAGDAAAEGAVEIGCGSGVYDFKTLVPGPGQAGYDAALEAHALRIERQFHVLNALATGVNADLGIALANADDRAAVEHFLRETDGWDFEASSGRPALEVITSHGSSVGLYGGFGIAADAYRYGTLRDQNADCAEIERARGFLLAALDSMHIAQDITGVPGVIARSIARTDLPGDGQSALNATEPVIVPLHDADGNPLPVEKNNGTWRLDNSGRWPGYLWIDSCSRDMYIGWAMAFGAAWEVMRDDPAISQEYKARLQADALALGQALMVVHDYPQENGTLWQFDLEIPDADDRTTFHGYMNENNVDRTYLKGFKNGFYAMMALGCVSALAYASEDPGLEEYLNAQLIGERKLHEITRDNMITVDISYASNYSNYNMVFAGAWLAMRYLQDPVAREAVQASLEDQLYAPKDANGKVKPRQPRDFGYSFFDFTYAGGMAGMSAWEAADGALVDQGAMTRGLTTLNHFPTPPYWDVRRENCPGMSCDQCGDTDAECGKCETAPEPGSICTDPEGGTFTNLGCAGRNCDMVTKEPIPMGKLPPSNFHWRSNPYVPNGGGDGSRLIPAVDFRGAYWLGRWTRVR
jgi:hypothetical protein